MNCYYGWNTDDGVLKESSSGGIFSALAEDVLSRGGAVFGAYMDPESYAVSHVMIRSAEETGKLRGSKYQQSDAAAAYSRAGGLLQAGTEVLFTGTPCQVAALRRYLKVKGIRADALLCAEVLCHGVTSTKAVRAYARSREKQRGSRITALRFRTKDRPWYQGSAMKLEYENGRTEVKDNLIDPFYLAYVNSMILRPSCYACPFAKQEGREADITIGDWWGAENDLRDREALRKGVGLMLANSKKGEAALRDMAAAGKIRLEGLDFGKAVKRNGALVKPAKKNPRREAFFRKLAAGEDFRAAVYSLYRKKAVKNRIKYLFGYDNTRRLKALKRRIKAGR